MSKKKPSSEESKAIRTDGMTPSDVEAMRLIQEAITQYEKSIDIANLPRYLKEQEEYQPDYSWKTPRGLVITGVPRAGLG